LFSACLHNAFCHREAPEFFGSIFGLRWQSAAATALSDANQPGLVPFQSGVAFRLPPQSKIFYFAWTFLDQRHDCL